MTNRFRISLSVERMLIFAVLAAVTLSLWSLRHQHTGRHRSAGGLVLPAGWAEREGHAAL